MEFVIQEMICTTIMLCSFICVGLWKVAISVLERNFGIGGIVKVQGPAEMLDVSTNYTALGTVMFPCRILYSVKNTSSLTP
jgi:hypothetical protein